MPASRNRGWALAAMPGAPQRAMLREMKEHRANPQLEVQVMAPEGACRRPAGRNELRGENRALTVHNFDAVAHLGIPPLRYTDGPNGIRGPDNVTAFPASLALAATFDERLAAASAPRRRMTPGPTSCSARRSTSPACRSAAACPRRWARIRISPAGSPSPRSAPSRTRRSSAGRASTPGAWSRDP
jgi:hypothetical protein